MASEAQLGVEAGPHAWAILTRIGFLARGEIIWVKAKGAAGSAAFGSYAKASNPVLRDVTERILVANKARIELSHQGECLGIDA